MIASRFIIIMFALLKLLSSQTAAGQSANIDTLNLRLPSEVKAPFAELDFPVVRTGNASIDILINTHLKDSLTEGEYTDLPVREALTKWAEDRIAWVNFEVTFNRKGLLSLIIYAEGCGAYCTEWRRFFTFRLSDGSLLSINDVVESVSGFKTIVIAEKDRQYDSQRKQLADMRKDPREQAHTDIYNSALQHYDDCDDNFELSAFVLRNDHLEIIERCDLPHFMKNLTPVIELKFKYRDIRKYLKVLLP